MSQLATVQSVDLHGLSWERRCGQDPPVASAHHDRTALVGGDGITRANAVEQAGRPPSLQPSAAEHHKYAAVRSVPDRHQRPRQDAFFCRQLGEVPAVPKVARLPAHDLIVMQQPDQPSYPFLNVGRKVAVPDLIRGEVHPEPAEPGMTGALTVEIPAVKA